jgi:hypothetical protein
VFQAELGYGTARKRERKERGRKKERGEKREKNDFWTSGAPEFTRVTK